MTAGGEQRYIGCDAEAARDLISNCEILKINLVFNLGTLLCAVSLLRWAHKVDIREVVAIADAEFKIAWREIAAFGFRPTLLAVGSGDDAPLPIRTRHVHNRYSTSHSESEREPSDCRSRRRNPFYSHL